MPIRTVTATRYVTPLREGGSLPAIVEADDDGLYVLKFRGAGQGDEGPDRGTRRRRTGARDRPAHSRDRARRARRGACPQRARSRDPGPDPRERRHQPRARLPAGLGHVRSARRTAALGARVVDRLVRRIDRQRRSHGAQREPAGLASRPLADRPRGRAVLPSRLGPSPREQSSAVRHDQGSRAAAVRERPRNRRPTASPR